MKISDELLVETASEPPDTVTHAATNDTREKPAEFSSNASATAAETTERVVYTEFFMNTTKQVEFIETNATTAEPSVEEPSTNRTDTTAAGNSCLFIALFASAPAYVNPLSNHWRKFPHPSFSFLFPSLFIFQFIFRWGAFP